jgi:UDP-hydrolysing UDP-N-acetyl-D-glucosamine 2-epimerase
MRAIRGDRRLELQLVVAGIHLLRRFGSTWRQIERDSWRIDARVPMQRGDDGPADQAYGLARGVEGIARFLVDTRTDVVLVLGDRIEAMAGALAGVTTGRIVAHIHGGDVAPGDFDDALRHAITKLAHVHLAATRGAARRIIRLGEDERRVHVVGAPGLDRLVELLEAEPPNRGRSGEALVVYHASGRSAEHEGRVMRAILRAVRAAKLKRCISYPNTDRGHAGVVAAIEGHRERYGAESVRVWRSLPRDEYLRALIRADVLVGNSSSGMIEAPLAGTPVVNVGERQAGRETSRAAVMQVGETRSEVARGLTWALRKRLRPGGRTTYGDGRAGARIAEILAGLPRDAGFLKKVITY